MRKFIDLCEGLTPVKVPEAKVLKEASYNYSQSQLTSIIFKAVRGGDPSIIFISADGKPLLTSEKVTIITVATRKVAELKKKAYGSAFSRTQMATEAEVNIGKAMTVVLASGSNVERNMDFIKKLPEYFKITTIDGRARFYRYATTDLKMPELLFTKFFGTPPTDLTHEHYDAFFGARIFFPETMRPNRKKSLMDMLKQVHDYLTKAGLDKSFSGDFRFIKQRSGVAGTYRRETKDIGISPDADNSKSVVYTLIHEFGHKHFFEVMTEEQRQTVMAKFKELKSAGVRYAAPAGIQQAVERLTPGVNLVYTGTKRALKTIGTFEVVPAREYGKISVKGAGKVFTGPKEMFITQDWKVLQAGVDALPDVQEYEETTSGWFPTKYAETIYYEWEAEIFTYHVLGNLTGEPEAWFVDLLAQSS